MNERKEYIEREALIKRLDVSPLLSRMQASCFLKEGVLDIIRKQPAISNAFDLIKRQQAEIDEQDQAIIKALKRMGEIRAAAIKEFAERLKESAFTCDVSVGYGREHYETAVAVIEIDNLVKEMTEGV